MEIAEIERKLRQAERKQAEEFAKQQQLRGELQLTKEKAKAEREKLERDVASQRARIENAIATLETECTRVTGELEMFDASLARFIQAKAPTAWRDAAKTLRRDILFWDARELEAKISAAAPQSFSAAKPRVSARPGTAQTSRQCSSRCMASPTASTSRLPPPYSSTRRSGNAVGNGGQGGQRPQVRWSPAQSSPVRVFRS